MSPRLSPAFAEPGVFALPDVRHMALRRPRLAVMDEIARVTPELHARALALCAFAHDGHVRAYSAEPYLGHLVEVRDIVAATPHATPAMCAAALLHDVVEDGRITGVVMGDVQRWFGSEVADLVGWLTDVSRKEDGNRAARKRLELEHTALAPPQAQTIKLADVLSNAKDIVQGDPKFAAVWLREKTALLKVLGKGDAELLARAKALVGNGLAALEAAPDPAERARPLRSSR